jgi:TfoX/Sxy family transcriptional regulator of competence genes
MSAYESWFVYAGCGLRANMSITKATDNVMRNQVDILKIATQTSREAEPQAHASSGFETIQEARN